MKSLGVIACVGLVCYLGGCAKDKPQVQTAENGALPGDVTLASAQEGPSATLGKIEPVVLFHGPMPTGVAVSRGGRIFVNFPRWGDPTQYTVAEIKNGQAVPYPDLAINKAESSPTDHLVSAQSVVVDGRDRLWILDTGSINFGPVKSGGPKLLAVDLNTDQIVKRISFPQDVALLTTYLNDVRFDLNRGQEGTAYITDSSDKGPNGIIVVDLASGRSWRRLSDHPSTKAEFQFTPTVEGQALMTRSPAQAPSYITIGADGLALSADGKQLYYCPLAGHHLYSVRTDALADQRLDDGQVAATVQDLGDREFASDGLLTDAQGRLYLTDYENNAIRRREANGYYIVVAQDPRMIWPDSMALSSDGYLYFICNQLNRQPGFHEGKDLREQPYVLFRTAVESRPLALR